MTNRVADILKIEKPIIQAPMLWLTDAKLVAAVSNAGASRADIAAASHGGEGMRLGMLVGDLTKGYASLGLGISQIHQIEPVAALMKQLTAGIPTA